MRINGGCIYKVCFVSYDCYLKDTKMKQTRRVLLECVGEIRPIYKATNVMIKCVEASGGRRHYYLPGRIRKGFMDQVTVELVSMQIKGKAGRTKKIEKWLVLYKQNIHAAYFDC